MAKTDPWMMPAPGFVEQRAIERIKVQGRRALDPVLTAEAVGGIEVLLLEEVDRLAVEIRRHMLAVDEESQVREVSYPRDWWEAVKQRFAPSWFLCRWPIRFRTHRLEVKSYGAVCPHHDIQAREPHEEFLVLSRTSAPIPVERVDERGWGTR